MASKRRGGGFRPPELRGTLGTLLRTTLQQAGVVRDALVRGASEGRSRLDDARSHRRRHDALAELGELVLDLIRRGEIDLDELPEARELVRHLDEVDDGAEADQVAAEPVVPVRPAARSRFDARSAPPAPKRAPRGADDGTVSSGTWSAPRPAQPSRVWRPPADDSPPAPAPRRALDPLRKGGISFDDDDLAEYMHPDDVPSKTPPDGDA